MRYSLVGVVVSLSLCAVAAQPAEECGEFLAKLDTCSPYTCRFKHPFTGESMERKINGIRDDRCEYHEEMPNNGRMDCRYTTSVRKAVVKYYRDTEVASGAGKTLGTQVTGSLGGKPDVKYTIDGKQVENPLQEAMKRGDCKVSGY